MKVIEKLENFIDSEIRDAEVYAKCALKYKESDPTLVRQIEQYRKTKGEPPAAMQAIYDYLHEKQIDKAKDVKSCQSMYRNG